MNDIIEGVILGLISVAFAVAGAAIKLATYTSKQNRDCLTKQELVIRGVTFECKLKERT